MVRSGRHTVQKQENRVLRVKRKTNLVQVQQQEHDAWQGFCAASVRVVPSEAATAATAPMQEAQPELYQHRLPQLADRMQRLLSEAGLTSQHAQGVLPAMKHDSSLLPYLLQHVFRSCDWYSGTYHPMRQCCLVAWPNLDFVGSD